MTKQNVYSTARRVVALAVAVVPACALALGFLLVKVEIANRWREQFSHVEVGETRAEVEELLDGPFEEKQDGIYHRARYSPSLSPFVFEVTYDNEERVVEKEIISTD